MAEDLTFKLKAENQELRQKLEEARGEIADLRVEVDRLSQSIEGASSAVEGIEAAAGGNLGVLESRLESLPSGRRSCRQIERQGLVHAVSPIF